MRGFQKLLEKRDLWSIGVFRYDRADDLFSAPPIELAYFQGENGFRVDKNYQSVAADPFLFTHGDRLYLFYEVKTDHGHGTIHAQSMSRDGYWHDHGQLLDEPFHLSYPQVFAFEDRIFMIPETAQSGAVRLYEAEEFPYHWRACATLIEAPLRDPTLIVTPDQGCFLLATSAEYELRLHHSEAIERPFRYTGVSITRDPRLARCAGGILKVGGQLLRPAQDCSEVYGKRIHFQAIEKLTPSAYCERPSGLTLQIPTAPWMSRGSHHISSANFGKSFFVAIDGRGADKLINTLFLGAIRATEIFYSGKRT